MELFDGKMKLDIPEDFRRLSDEEKGCFFHGDIKPQVVLEDAAGGQLALLLTDKMAQSVHLDSICSDFYFLIRQRYPASFFLEKGRLKLQDESLVWMDFQGNTIAETKYYLLFLTTISGRLLIGLFQCAWNQMGKQKNKILEILQGMIDVGDKTY